MKFPFKKGVIEKLRNSESKDSITKDLIGFKLFQGKIITKGKDKGIIKPNTLLPDLPDIG